MDLWFSQSFRHHYCNIFQSHYFHCYHNNYEQNCPGNNILYLPNLFDKRVALHPA